MRKFLVYLEGVSEPEEVLASGYYSNGNGSYIFYRTVIRPGMSGRYVPRRFWFGERWENYFNEHRTENVDTVMYRFSTVLKIEGEV